VARLAPPQDAAPTQQRAQDKNLARKDSDGEATVWSPRRLLRQEEARCADPPRATANASPAPQAVEQLDAGGACRCRLNRVIARSSALDVDLRQPLQPRREVPVPVASSSMLAGTSTMRMIVASRMTAIARPNPTCWKVTSSPEAMPRRRRP